jgi:hypothetical protein
MKQFIFFLFAILVNNDASIAYALNATPEGLWQTIDDRTGKPRSLVRIIEKNG